MQNVASEQAEQVIREPDTAAAQITVREYMDEGVAAGRSVWIDTAWGAQQVTSFRLSFDGPWVVCGKENGGFGISYAVFADQPLTVRAQ